MECETKLTSLQLLRGKEIPVARWVINSNLTQGKGVEPKELHTKENGKLLGRGNV